MGKIAISTIIDYENYGNRLQNYAVQEVLKSLGYTVDTMIFSGKPLSNKIGRLSQLSYKDIFLKLNNRTKDYFNKKKKQRIQNFREFSVKYIDEKNYPYLDNDSYDEFLSSYDFFITGSDQVWNPIFRKGSSIDFLTFAPIDKRIAYAPSFGIADIPTEYVEKYKIWLTEMASLSVREEAGAKIIKNLTGRDAAVLVDPTVMLTKEKWLSIAKPSLFKPSKNYMLTYFLGGIPEEYEANIRNISKKNDLDIISLGDMRIKQTYLADPGAFIDFINSASVLCTDSFHGAVFSILLETPFIVFERKGKEPSMNSRIETLLSTFQLESRLEKNIKNNSEIFQVDYSHVSDILETERRKAHKYLKNALKVKEFVEV